MSLGRFTSLTAANVEATSEELNVIFDPSFEKPKKKKCPSSFVCLKNLAKTRIFLPPDRREGK